MKNFYRRAALVAICILTAGVIASLYINHLSAGNSAQGDLIPVTNTEFAAPFTLTDHNGNTVNQDSYNDKYRLIYFGFTYCPAICPTELAKITAALNAIGEKAQNIQPVFVTVDPERDTQEKMKSYVAMFHPALVGLTGTPEQVSQALKSFKVYAAKVEDPDLNDYTMDHSSFIYFIHPDGRLLQIFKMDDSAQIMAETMGRWLKQD